MHLKEEFLNLYKILRLRCTPQQQDKDAPAFASIGRQNRRRLHRIGEETMKRLSAARMLETWHWIENRQVCVWIDNCYSKQYPTHSTIQDQSQSCRALCVVEIPCTLPYFKEHPTMDVLSGSIGNVAAALVRMKPSFCGIVTDGTGTKHLRELPCCPAVGIPNIPCDKRVAALSFSVRVLPLWPLRSWKNSRLLP